MVKNYNHQKSDCVANPIRSVIIQFATKLTIGENKPLCSVTI